MHMYPDIEISYLRDCYNTRYLFPVENVREISLLSFFAATDLNETVVTEYGAITDESGQVYRKVLGV